MQFFWLKGLTGNVPAGPADLGIGGECIFCILGFDSGMGTS